MQNAYYLKISECPLIAWEKRYKEGNSAIRMPDVNFNYTEETDYDAWDLLYIDWEENVKLDSSFVQYKKDLRRYLDLMIKYRESKRIRNGVEVHDNSILNDIQIMEAIVLKYEKNLGRPVTINKMVQKLSRLEGRQIKKIDLTVQDYFDLIELNTK
jgi:hypothetical protein